MICVSMALSVLSVSAVSIEYEDVEIEESNSLEDNSLISSEEPVVEEVYTNEAPLMATSDTETYTNSGIMLMSTTEQKRTDYGNILSVAKHQCKSSPKTWYSAEYTLNVIESGYLYFTVGGENCGASTDEGGIYVYDSNRNLISSNIFHPLGHPGSGIYEEKEYSVYLTKGT